MTIFGKNQRRKKFIDPKVQGALIRRIGMHYLIFFATSCGVGFCMQILSDPLAPFSQHTTNLWSTMGPFLITGLFLLPVFLFDTVSLSHRFVGPILRVRNTLKSVASGNRPTAIKLRPDDFWIDLADDVNGMLAHLGSKKQPQSNELVEN